MEDNKKEEQELEELAVGNTAEAYLTMVHPLSAGAWSIHLPTQEEEMTSERVFTSHCRGAECGEPRGGGVAAGGDERDIQELAVEKREAEGGGGGDDVEMDLLLDPAAVSQ